MPPVFLYPAFLKPFPFPIFADQYCTMPPVYIITTTHPFYQQVIDLRQRVLRAPLGLDIYKDDLEAETEQIIFIYEEDGLVLGCVLLQHADAETFKLRQMAVAPESQGKGIGAALVQAAETYALQTGKKQILLHARNVAIPFYEKSGYVAEGKEFTEVGIPHHHMRKNLADQP